MNTPKVSVIIPTYNRAQMVEKAIDSVLSQTYPNIELIVVDDGSTDATREVLETYGNRIVAVYQTNGGAGKARNTGLGIASGEFIAFLDSDDYYLPDKIRLEAEYLCAHPDVDVVLCGFRYIDEEKQVDVEIKNIEVTDLVSRILWTDIGGLFPPNLPLFRRKILEKVNGFDERLKMREEQDFWLQIALAGFQFRFIDEVLCVSRSGKQSKGRAVDRVEPYLMMIFEKVFNHPNLPRSVAAHKDEIYARVFLHINYSLAMGNKYALEEKIAITKKYAHQAFENQTDISHWRPDTIDPFLYVIQNIDHEHQERFLNEVLVDPVHPNVRSYLFAELYLIRAFQARDKKNRGDVIKNVLKAIRTNTNIVRHKGTVALLGHALLK